MKMIKSSKMVSPLRLEHFSRGADNATMSHDRNNWTLACELACTGDYENVVMIEYELRRRGRLVGNAITHNAHRREHLTRVCHAAREGKTVEIDLARDLPRSQGRSFG
jgi:hypothetical protein